VQIPIIVVTAHDQPELREQCMTEGAAAYLAKPLQREHLVGLIRNVIGFHAGSLQP
jgi:CheY-like chemotaxis protein